MTAAVPIPVARPQPRQVLSALALAGALLALLPAAVRAAGDDTSTPPPPTPTQRCPDGQIYDAKTRQCLPPRSSAFDDGARYAAVRELAYAGRHAAAAAVLDAMEQQGSDQVLTYRGFLARKAGQWEQAVRLYTAAIQANPANLLARSYMGQGHVEAGDTAAARRLLDEIVARGGAGTWAETSLRQAIATGRTADY